MKPNNMKKVIICSLLVGIAFVSAAPVASAGPLEDAINSVGSRVGCIEDAQGTIYTLPGAYAGCAGGSSHEFLLVKTRY